MENPCKKCGYFSDRPARFCRQCGTPLFEENEASSADTMNYGAQKDTDPNRPYTSQHAQYGIYNDPAQHTDRFYHPPSVPDYGAPQPPKKSNAKIWLIVLLILVIFAGGGLFFLARVISTARDRVRPVVAEQIEEQIREAIREAQERAREAQENMPEGAPPPPPAPGSGAELSVQQFGYPNGKVRKSTNVIGNEFLEITTTDKMEKVREHYDKLIGQPIITSTDEDGENVIYQVQGASSLLVTLSPDDEVAGNIKITVIKSWFVPRLNQRGR